jgi:hypothetical protein
MKLILAFCSVLLLPTFQARAADTPASTINLSTPAQVPGMTLDPGSYSIRVVGKLNDRLILKVKDVRGKTSVDFLGVPSPSKGSPGITAWSQPVAGTTFLRGWVPPGSSSMIEFVYPKDEAVSIATVNQAKVPAIDPASEGRSVDPTLSTEDMKLVTLWLLSSTRVGPSESKPSIKAERYNVASITKEKPVLAALPHTAGSLPLVLFASLSSLTTALLLRFRRSTLFKSQI